MVTCDGHERCAEHLSAGESVFNHPVANLHLEVVGHVNGAYIIITIDFLKGILPLCVAHVGLVSVVFVRVAMSHEEHGALLGVFAEVFVELLGEGFHIFYCCHERGAQLDGHF